MDCFLFGVFRVLDGSAFCSTCGAPVDQGSRFGFESFGGCDIEELGKLA